ncbi:Fum3p [Nannizzia gypsea CBS 118893]|uniref:Fum3p n=1 Tax=Arthroderma gypseum (strain ATCC MYA-4604 / CBS 118893) TaxID=535722 RepID=E4UP24_ARTGP|nr:Fum3p [Nannizzia gypsea CBS 118893]EFQ99777.1 Fum3p [Nannizzia gypsea CBS 118893]
MSEQIERFPMSAGPDVIFESYKKNGVVVIEQFVTKDQLERFTADVEPALQKLIAGYTSRLDGNKEADDFFGKKTKRLGQLSTVSPVFRHEILEHDFMHSLLERVFIDSPLDGYWMNTSDVIEIGPGSKPQPIHRDLELWYPFAIGGPAMPEAICNFMVALTPFTAENGATVFAPGTNHNESFERLEDGELPGVDKTISGVMNPGDCAFFSGKVVHGGGTNSTADEFRRGLSMSFIRRILSPEQAHPLSISREIAESMAYRGQAMLGFRSQWPIVEDGPAIIWSYQGSDIGKKLGLGEKN